MTKLCIGTFAVAIEIPETDLRNLARTLMNPETGYAETLKIVSGGLTPEQLSIIAEAEEEASEIPGRSATARRHA